MSASAKLSPAKAERIRALAEKLAEAARKYDEALKQVPAHEWPTSPVFAAQAARDAARAAIIRECETPEDA